MDELTEFLNEADRKSPFIKFEEGKPVRGIYKGVTAIDDTFNKGEKTLEYTLEVDEVEKTFKSSSTKLARLMLKIEKGKEVELVRTGQSFDTKWYVYSGDELKEREKLEK